MIAVALGFFFILLIGLPISLAIGRSSLTGLLGTVFLYGAGFVYFVLLAFSILHIQWRPVPVVCVGLVACGVASLIAFKQAFNRPALTVRFHWVDLVTIIVIVGYALYATIAPPWGFDFWVLKGRVFFEHGGIDWRFLQSPWNTYAHVDYPLLVPLNFDFLALLGGGWSDRWLGALDVAWAVAVLLIVRDLASRESSVFVSALVTFAAASLAATSYIGFAEGAMIAFGSAGVLFVRRALTSGASADWRHGALLLGLAANVKNEGLGLLAAVAIALLIVRRRELFRIWPAVALAIPWVVLRAAHALTTDILSSDVDAGSALRRIVVRLPRTTEILEFMGHVLSQPWFWVAVLVAVLVTPATVRRESFVLFVTIFQFFFVVVAYFATPYNVHWHIATSFDRLANQIALPVTFVVVLALANYAFNTTVRPSESP